MERNNYQWETTQNFLNVLTRLSTQPGLILRQYLSTNFLKARFDLKSILGLHIWWCLEKSLFSRKTPGFSSEQPHLRDWEVWRNKYFQGKIFFYQNWFVLKIRSTGRLRENLLEASGPGARGEDVPQDRPRHGQEGRCREDKEYASGVYWWIIIFAS